ncbi:MAG: hypothetical protein QME40_04475 [bacterium]|nr:hypothetical protein [bacterium]
MDLETIIDRARELSWKNFGKRITFYHPGMFYYEGEWGRYSAISITGKRCILQCDHCKGKILDQMPVATTPQELVALCCEFDKRGDFGCLITGGSLANGSLPWKEFIPAIKEVKSKTRLFLSIHSGIIERKTAWALKEAGIDQALIDVIGDDEIAKKVCHIDSFIDKVTKSIEAFEYVSLPVIPHIVVGIDYGNIRGEYKAIDILKPFSISRLVIVVLMPLVATPMEGVEPPKAEDVSRIIAYGRINMPFTHISLGCARPRGDRHIDVLAVDCGVNSIAIPSQEAIKRARGYGLSAFFQKTCCSVPEGKDTCNYLPK